jgi:hypothetical protein
VVIITYEQITLSGTQSIQGIDLGVNDRVLVAAQGGGTVSGFTLNADNGIYTVQEGAWVRSNDADNDPNEEVTKGMFTFVEEGAYADQGFVLSIITNPIAGPNDRLMADLGVSELKFSQFSGAGQITAGSGLTKTGNTLDVNVDDITIEIVSDTLQVKDNGITTVKIADANVTTAKIADANVTTAKIADANVTTAKIADDSVTKEKINSDVAGNGLLQNVDGSLEVNGSYIQGLIEVVDSSSIDFTKTGGNITASLIIGSASDSSFTIESDGVTLNRTTLADNLKGTTADTSLSSSNGVLIVEVDGITIKRDADGKLYSDVTTSALAGVGLTANGGELDVVATNGLSVDATSDSVELGGALTKNTTILSTQSHDLTFDGVGAFMVKDVESFDVTADFVMIDAGTGITQILGDGDITINSYSGQVFLGATGNSIAISATSSGDIIATSQDGKGIQYADNYTASFVTNSLVTKQYVDGLVSANSGATMVNANKDMVAESTVDDGDLATNAPIANTPAGYVQVFVNGVKVSLGNGVTDKDCYFSADGGDTAKAISDIANGDFLYWNGSLAGYQLDTFDSIDFDYELTGI